MPDAFRASRRAGRIEHVRPGRLVGDRRRRELRAGFLEILIIGNGAAHRELALDLLRHVTVFQQLLGRGRNRRGGEQHPRAAIRDDIGDLACGQAGGDAGVVEPCPLRRPADLVEARVIVHEDRDGVARLQARIPEEMRKLVGALVELLEADAFARRRHDVGGLVGRGAHMG